MRISFVTNFIPPYRKTFYEKLCADHNHQWQVLRGRVDKETGRPDYRGNIAAPTVQVENVERAIGPYTVRYQAGALREVRAFGPDVLVVLGMVGNLSNWLLMAWARLTGRKVIVWACGWEPQRVGSLALHVKQALLRTYFAMADRALLYSTKGLNYLGSCGADRHRMRVCFNGIEIDDLLRDEARIRQEAEALRQTYTRPGNFVFLYVGGLLDEKRVDLLIDAFAQLRRDDARLQLWIVGDGPAAAKLNRLADSKDAGGIQFFGRIIDGVDAYFAAADVFVLPGLGGLAFNQAMFWRTPCIGAEADGTEDDLVVDGETGFRFATDDPGSLRHAMQRAYQTPSLELASMGERSRRIIEERSNVDSMVRVFHEEVARLSRA